MPQVIADTSGLYALVDRKDPHHAQAVAFLKSQTMPKWLVVSNHVFDETMTAIGRNGGLTIRYKLIKQRFYRDCSLFSGSRTRNMADI